MADLHISEELARRIREEAEAANLDIEAFLNSKLPPKEEKTASVTLGALAAALRDANIRTGYTDTAKRFEDILDEEFANDLLHDQKDMSEDDQSAG
jgi:hypothetical protein